MESEPLPPTSSLRGPAAPEEALLPAAAGSHVDDNMWKPLRIPQDVRCPSGRLGLGTQGGPAFRALPWGRVPPQ